MEDWDEHKVSKFVGSVGNGKVWLQYAKKCLEDGIDGQTLVSVDVGDLIEMGFTKPHAKAVLSARDLSNSVKVMIPNANSVVTEAELAEMQRLACHRELLAQSASQISLALEGLTARVRGHHTQVDQTVDETIAKWEQARVCAHAKLDIDQANAKQQLEQALAKITENQRTFEATSSQAAMLYSAPIHVTDAAALKQRQAQITTLTQECLGSPFTALAREPEWRVDYVYMPADKLLVDVESFPCTTVARYALPPLSISVEATSTSAEANWSLPAEYPAADAKFQYRVQLACSGVRPEGAPPPYDEKEDSGEYQDVYRGEGRCCSLRSLNVATSFCLRVRLENGSVCGKWNSATFCTLKVPPKRKMFDVTGSAIVIAPCYAFQKGECIHGSSCRYAHDAGRKMSDVPGSAIVIAEPCYAFQKGECIHGSSCRYAHDPGRNVPGSAIVIAEPCYAFQKGECLHGSSCRYAHDAASSRDRGGGGFCFDFQKGRCSRGEGCRFTHIGWGSGYGGRGF